MRPPVDLGRIPIGIRITMRPMVRNYKPVDPCPKAWFVGARHCYVYPYPRTFLSECLQCGAKNPRPRPGAVTVRTAKRRAEKRRRGR